MPKTKELKNFEYISLTDKGKLRQKNEDHLGYFDTLNGHVFVVCDGIGGHVGGEIASSIAVNSVKFFFSNYYYKDLKKAIKDAISYANKQIIDEASFNKRYTGMGTTIVLLVVRNNQVYYGHVGDSRLYIYSKNIFKKLTKDHTVVQKMIDEKVINEKEAENHPRKNELTQALGISTIVKPTINEDIIYPSSNDKLLLCSDGLYDMVKHEKIQKYLSGNEKLQQKGQKLIDKALKAGGKDNISIQIIDFFNLDTNEEKINKEPDKKKEFKNINWKYWILFVIITLFILIISRHNHIYFWKKNIKAITYTKKLNQSSLFIIKIKNKKILQEYIQIKEKYSNKSEVYSKYKNEILEQYNINEKKAYIKLTDSIFEIVVPIKKIHNVEFYDNINILARIYKIDVRKIMEMNQLKSKYIEPGTQLIIPLQDD